MAVADSAPRMACLPVTDMPGDPFMDLASVLEEGSGGAVDSAAEVLVGVSAPEEVGAEVFGGADSTLPGAGNAHKIRRFRCTSHLKKSEPPMEGGVFYARI